MAIMPCANTKKLPQVSVNTYGSIGAASLLENSQFLICLQTGGVQKFKPLTATRCHCASGKISQPGLYGFAHIREPRCSPDCWLLFMFSWPDTWDRMKSLSVVLLLVEAALNLHRWWGIS